ncbi:MAG: GUN4 N-terminal ARM-like repeat domain-containing protein [Cyanophyceae cyanobacterium]
MPDQPSAFVDNERDRLLELSRQFESASPKKQLQLVPELVNAGEPGLAVLQNYLRSQSPQRGASAQPLSSAELVLGKISTVLYQLNSSQLPALDSLNGVVALNSERNINYQLLQHLLIQQDFQAADSLTRQQLCELAGEAAKKRKWLYFTEVEQFPIADLRTIDRLWWTYSEGKFGFSVQRQLWLAVGQDFSKLWPKIGWRTGNRWTQYPNEFTWNLSAPRGHLPLSNQLRGVRVIASVFSHPAWSSEP